MKLIAGLGNPGPEYETTRHNVGFLAIDRLIERWSAKGPSKQSKAEVYKADAAGEKILLIKPQTFMNLSGQSVSELLAFYKIAPKDLIVIHDDLDLPSLSLRIKTGGGDGGHNGLKSIDQHLGALGRDYHRIRIGIGRPEAANPNANLPDAADWVLAPYRQSELTALDPILDQVAEAVELCVKDQVKEAMNKFNRKEKKESPE